MANKGIIASGILGSIVVLGGVGYLVSKKPSTPTSPSVATLSSINLTASPTSITPGTSVTFTATAYDQNGNPLPGVSLTLFDMTTSTGVSMGQTNSSGVASVSVPFPNSGSFVMYAEA